ncbi:PRK06851 family protein [Paenibacillus sp. FA6]|uniref:PRK06851 family protein n=1 Tax=Paenibacillus sp. FA6 TaxID=3413029 RepID=UPI003F655D9A
MNEIVRNYYANGNTASGNTSLLDSSLQGLEHLFILQGPPGTGKSSLISTLSDQIALNGHETWLMHCPSDNESLDGLIIPRCKVGIVIETASHSITPTSPETVLHYVDLGNACDPAQLSMHKIEIESLNEQISQANIRAYAGFAEALRIHDEWEVLYIENMDFKSADELTNEYIQILFGDGKLNKQSRVDHRFLGAATPKGAVDFVPNLTAGLNRYLLKGRPGSGKSTMLKKWAAVGIERGFDVEIYHCGFDPNSLDMLIVRELQFAIFDSTAPHEYFPDRDTDEIVDIYPRCIKPGTDEALAEEILHVSQRYSSAMKQSIQHLAEAKSFQDELSNIYTQSMDFSLVDRMMNELQEEIHVIIT